MTRCSSTCWSRPPCSSATIGTGCSSSRWRCSRRSGCARRWLATRFQIAPFEWDGDPNDTVGVLWHFYSNSLILDFVFGIALASWMSSGRTSVCSRWVFCAGGAVGVAALVAGHNVWPRGLAAGIPAAVVVACAVCGLAGLRFRLLDLLGSASYALYLFHWTTFGLLKPYARWLGPTAGHPVKITLLILAHVTVATAVCVGIHLAIERPYLRWLGRRRLSSASRSPVSQAHREQPVVGR